MGTRITKAGGFAAPLGRLATLTATASSLFLMAACSAPAYPPPGRAALEPIAPRVSAAPAPATTTPAPPSPAQSARPAAEAPVPMTSERSAVRNVGSNLPDKKERWWPEWSDPANWFLDERYRL